MKQDITPLLAWMRAANDTQRERMARLAGTSVSYLYQIATCKRPNPTAQLAVAIEDATQVMSVEGLPLVTVRELSTMCAMRGL